MTTTLDVAAECARCGVTAADLPYEELGLSLDEASETMFGSIDGQTACNGCVQLVAHAAGGRTTLDLAAAACERHADGCPTCDVPNVDRGNAGCTVGRLLATVWAGLWRAKVDGLSDRRRA